MRRLTLITELLSVSESSSVAWPTGERPPCATRHRQWGSRALLIGTLLLLACGCQTNNNMARLFQRPKTQEKNSLQTMLGQRKAGLPNPSNKTATSEDSLTPLLDRGQAALSAYYKDFNPTHLTEAHRCYEQAIAIQPGNSESHHGLAIVCDLQKDYQPAELHYQAALENAPNNSQILGDLGYSYLLQGRLMESENILVKATKLDPGNIQATKNLACVYGKQEEYGLAESTYRRVMDEAEVRQEMAKLPPKDPVAVAQSRERGKLPWQGRDRVTTDQLKDRLEQAQNEDIAEMRKKRSLLDQNSAPALTNEQLQAQVAQMALERDQAYRELNERKERASNTPLVLGNASPQSGRGATAGMQINPQGDLRASNPSPGEYVAGGQTSRPTPVQPQPNPQGRRARNVFYPNGTAPLANQGIDQASGQEQPRGPNGQTRNEPAYYETNQRIDPRTGRPLNPGIQQTDGQGPLLVPNGMGSDQQAGHPNNSGSASPGAAAFEDAKRRAALAGMGGPEMMFNVPSITVPTVNSPNRMTPGTGSTWNGGQYPQPQRMLPMDAAPHDLNSLMQAPSGEMTVQPNQMGMLNSPTGRSFSNPNYQHALQPQIPLDSPMGNQGMNYVDQATSAQEQGQDRTNMYGASEAPQGQSRQTSAPPQRGTDQGNDDPRDRVNSDLTQYDQMQEYRPAPGNQSGWNQTTTPSYGLPNQPQVESPNKWMAPGWNQQQLTPRFTPPPYSSRSMQGGDDQSSMPRGGYGNAPLNDRQSQGGTYDSTRAYPTEATSSVPTAIYSPGIRVPAEYGSGTRATNTFNQGANGPRIIPGSR